MKTILIIIGAAAIVLWAILALQQFLTDLVMEENGAEIDAGLMDERGRPIPQPDPIHTTTPNP